jgi:hypothetical protein
MNVTLLPLVSTVKPPVLQIFIEIYLLPTLTQVPIAHYSAHDKFIIQIHYYNWVNNSNTTIIRYRYRHDQQIQSLVVRHTGLTGDCLLPTSLTELTGLMPASIMSSFADNLQFRGVRATK